MVNERKTEKIVRQHFEPFEKKGLIKIEEQKSENPEIKKLLKNASKSGKGAGYPEFIISIKDCPELLIVIECKADTKFHNDEIKDLPRDYAVQGVLLYSQYLSKNFDVLSIAVSGENKSNLKITHHLQLKNSLEKPVEKFGNKLLSTENYLEQYRTSEEKFRQDYDTLLIFSKELNEQLQKKKVKESDRALLIGGILIALENTTFKDTFNEYTEEGDLSKELYDKIEMQYKNNDIKGQKLEAVMEHLVFIKSHPTLSEGKTLIKIIKDVDENINTFVRTHKYYDVLGELYIEFLRYANSDKGLGIVLTPRHITEFMAKLAEINEKSFVYDNCTGTGGFLVSAMRLMIEKAKGNRKRIESIKQKQLLGTEFQPNIYALAISNMFIHQDGKTSILKGNCFDEEIMKKVKNKKPNVGLLNPPYGSNRKELEFVLNNLDCLQQNGKCVAILPMQTALATNGDVLEAKKRIFENHTLEAVLSMPNELFKNSKVSVVSCIMVFTAGNPHPTNKKVFFGYFKDDGFVNKKPKGRVDLHNKWNRIEEKWLEYYTNKEDVAGVSINKCVEVDDEWSAEAYMETDYSDLSKKDFEKTIRDFVAFQIINKN